MFLAAYVGSSMNPTLREPEMIEVIPYDNRPLRVGDVIFYLPSQTEQPVVHRIIRMTPAGIFTRGDNNARKDDYLVQPQSIHGRVVAAWRGQQKRNIAGGLRGRLTGHVLHGRRRVLRAALPWLEPVYQALSRRGSVARLLPVSYRPRVVVFRTGGRDQFQLLMGQRVIGRYNDQRHQWQIRRPFHLFVDQKLFPRQQAGARANRSGSTKRQETLEHLRMHGEWHCLDLADGVRWEIFAGDKAAVSTLAQLGSAMQLRVASGGVDPLPRPLQRRRLLVEVAEPSAMLVFYTPLAAQADDDVLCILSAQDQAAGPYINLLRLSLVFARDAQARGGILIHGALVERAGRGYILTGAGGAGKSTASQRIPAPWRARCDDTTLVVRDSQGRYWAHPWPTWSRYLDGGSGGTWDVQSPVQLAGIFILAQSAEDRAERIGSGQAVSQLVECVGQVSTFITPSLFKEEIRSMHLEQFNNLSNLVREIPVYVLHVSLTGRFWDEMEQALKMGSRKAEAYVQAD